MRTFFDGPKPVDMPMSNAQRQRRYRQKLKARAAGDALGDRAREAVERQMVQQSLKKHGGKIAPAAVELGLSRPTLYELMEKLGIDRSA